MLSTRYVLSDVHRAELSPVLGSSERSTPLPTDRARRAQVAIPLRAQRPALGQNLEELGRTQQELPQWEERKGNSQLRAAMVILIS